MPTHSDPPDETSRGEHEPVSTAFDAGTERRIKRWGVLGAALLLIGFVAVGAMRIFHAHGLVNQGEANERRAPPVDVIIAKAATGGQELVLPGQTTAWYESAIYARVNGYVAKWMVDIGDHVAKDQVLALIETPELDAELSGARAQLQAAEAQVVARKAEAEFGKSTNERWRDSPKGVVSDQERDAKSADYKGAQARVYAANAQVALDRARVDQYRTLAEFKQVKASFDGTITERKIDVGNLVTAGSSSSTTMLYRISQTDTLRIFVDAPQAYAGELMKPDVPAQIRATGAVGGVFTAKIARTSAAMNPAARTLRVEVDVANADHALVPGMYVNVAFSLPARGLVEVPAAALIFRAGTTQVAQVGADEKVQFNTVTIARDNGGMVELASGVKPGDRLVLNISSQIGAGQQVVVTQPDATRPATASR